MERIKYILALIFAIFFLGSMALFFGPLALVVAILYTAGVWLSESFFYRKMVGRNRAMRRAAVATQLAQARGTLIVEWIALGFGYSRLWWTPEDLPSICPYPLPEPGVDTSQATRREKLALLGFTEWVKDNFIDSVNGRALLISPRNGRKVASRLLQRFPATELVEVWTAGIGYLRTELEGEPGDAAA